MLPTKTIRRTAVLASLMAVVGCEEARSESELEDLMRESEPKEVSDSPETFSYDVSENMYRFTFAEAPIFDDGMPAYGNPFITQGYIYPAGFLDDKKGANPDGSPAYPEKVIGEWTCRGYMIGDGAHTEQGPMVITTQYWDFYADEGYEPGKQRGQQSLVTEGYESADVGKTWRRPITGGTGKYAGVDGQAKQQFLGLNPSEGFDLRVEFTVDD